MGGDVVKDGGGAGRGKSDIFRSWWAEKQEQVSLMGLEDRGMPKEEPLVLHVQVGRRAVFFRVSKRSYPLSFRGTLGCPCHANWRGFWPLFPHTRWR